MEEESLTASLGEPLESVLDLTSWRDGKDQSALYEQLKTVVAESVAQSERTRQPIRDIVIDEFFPSIKYPLVLKACARLCGGSLSPAAFALVADLCSFKGELPAGAPSSTGIANLVLSSLDKALTTICHRHGIAYTRYADDLTFSGNGDVKRIIPFVRKCLADLNLRVDEKKLNLYRRGRRQIVTGLVVNDKPNLPRRLRKRLRAAVHHRSLGQETTWHGKPMNDNELLGRLAFLKQVQPEEAERHRQKLREARKEVEGNDVIIES